MSAAAPPLRFLAVVLGGWICVRAAILLPDWAPAREGNAAAASAVPGSPAARSGVLPAAPPARMAPASGISLHLRTDLAKVRPLAVATRPGAVPLPPPIGARSARQPPPPAPLVFAAPPLLRSRSDTRWSGSAWLLVRRETAGTALAPGGTLGGSQAGARILYRLNGDPARPLALSLRVYTPLRRTAGAEAALGLDWRPAAAIPLRLLAERRQAIGEAGHSAFALTLYGGMERRFGPVRAGAYAQAGLVGLRRRDPFVDGSLTLRVPAGPVEIGGGMWAAAQPGAARVDAGPHVSLPLRGTGFRLSGDWRFRIAGDARPGSGPALTLAADF